MTPALQTPNVLEHMGLVHACAGRLKGRGVDYEDLVQNGCVGLMKAAAAFDPTRGLQFSTYAVPVILGEMRRLFRDGQAVRVGRSCQDLARQLARLQDAYINEHDRSPTVSELCSMTGASPERVVEALTAGQQPLSLTEPEEGGQFDLPVESGEAGLTDRLGLQQVVQRLSREDQQLLHLRYQMGLTQSETGKHISMTQVQVSRREKKILTQLRASLEAP